MAITATNTAVDAQPFFARLGAAVSRFAVTYAEARSRQAQIAMFDAMSDAELAEHGITRDGIVRHVFADTYFL